MGLNYGQILEILYIKKIYFSKRKNLTSLNLAIQKLTDGDGNDRYTQGLVSWITNTCLII